MPVIRTADRGGKNSTRHAHLVRLLVKELMGERTIHGPVIFEDPTGAETIEVTVVWEAWLGLPNEARDAIIREAHAEYGRAIEAGIARTDPDGRPDSSPSPRLGGVIGVTWADVVELGLLPFAIRPRPGHGLDSDDIEMMMIREGAIEAPTGVELRMPSASMASNVIARLAEEMPGVSWSLVEIPGPSGQGS